MQFSTVASVFIIVLKLVSSRSRFKKNVNEKGNKEIYVNKEEHKLGHININISKGLIDRGTVENKIKSGEFREVQDFEKYLKKQYNECDINDFELNNFFNEVFENIRKEEPLFQLEWMTNDGFEFEKYIADLLSKLGYKNVEILPKSGDFGVDIIANKERVIYAIQCKHYQSKVSISSVQEITSGRNYYGAHIGVVVTNNYFTQPALELANRNRVILWDRDTLEKMVLSTYK